MGQYIIKRFLTIVPVLVGISIIVFGFIHLIPGDPAVTMLGERATPERVAEIRTQLGLDQPLLTQYFIYAGKILRGDLGASILRGDPVLSDLIRRFPATVELALSAFIRAILIGIPAGIVSAVWRNSVFDGLSRILALTGVSMPIFWLGLMLAWVFGVLLGWLPTGFRLGTSITLETVTHFNLLDSLITGNGEAFVASLRHLVLPAVALSTIPMAVITRMTRASLLEVLSQDYIRTAESKGLPQRAVVLRHAMRNALLPVLTVTGLQIGRLLAGAILTETIFSWPGIGRLAIQSIYNRDYPVVQSCVFMTAAMFVVVNFLVDVAYGVLDPRIRH
jgi:peptide/nickel transport system permease protein